MTLHWWMHWFWVTLIHSVVAIPLLVPSTLTAPSQDKHAIQLSVSSPSATPHEAIPWVAKEPVPNIQRDDHLFDGVEANKAGKDHQISPPTETLASEGSASTEGSVVGKEPTQIAKDANNGDITNESSKEVPLFLEAEDEQGWGLEEPAPRPPFFLQSPNLEDVYDDEEEESLHTSDGMPWLPGSIPRVEIGSSSERPTINSSHELPLPTVEPWPANISPDQSAAGESPPDVSEGGESAGRGPREEPHQPNPEPHINSSPLPEAIITSEASTSPSSVWTLLYSTSSPFSSPHSTSSIPSYSSAHFPLSTDSSYSTPSDTDSLSSNSPLYTDRFLPSTTQYTPTTISDVPPTLSSLLIPSDTLSSDAVHVREGKAIGVSHIDQQPKQEQKQMEISDGSNVSVLTTPMPTKFEVDSSPVKSSSKSNSTTVVVGKEDEVRKENDTLDSSGPLTVNSSSSNSDEKVKKEEESVGTHPPPVSSEEVTVKDKEEGVEGAEDEKEIESKNNTGSVVETSDLDVGKPTQEEEIISPVEVPTAVAVREGGIKSSQPEENKDNDSSGEPSKNAGKEPITTVADVPSSVHQGRMTAPRSLDAASIVGISLGSVLLVGAVAGGVGFVLYRRSLYANKPQTLNDKCSNPDSSGYIDDTLRVSSACTSERGPRPAPRSRVEVTRNGRGRRGGGRGGGGGEGGKQRRPSGPKENSEEMYSLDNDSFLNSLEAMTIQNYWTDSVKHTKL